MSVPGLRRVRDRDGYLGDQLARQVRGASGLAALVSDLPGVDPVHGHEGMMSSPFDEASPGEYEDDVGMLHR